VTGTAGAVRRDLRKVATSERAALNRWFFKTGPGEYGAGDRFLGVTVPQIRAIARRYESLSLSAIVTLLKSPWHEERLFALLILVSQYARGDESTRRALHQTYVRHIRWVNNWDLVDSSAEMLVGAHLAARSRRPLRRLATSRNVWERRIAMIATYHYIKKGEFEDALAIAQLLVKDEHDLIHKAVGWMLREVGKRDRAVEEKFLRRHAHHMPRTMLRYAVERFPERLRHRYLRVRRVR
jgi:3-methyladenine DNA glycosylase AlkD